MNNMYTRRIKRYLKDRIKKLFTKRYHISPKNILNRQRYYIIRRNAPWAGFFANYLYVVGHISYALKKGYVPVVDMENYPTFYNESSEFNGTLNAWEYYFVQPSHDTLSDAYKSGNYILSDISTMREYIPYEEGDNFFKIDWNQAADTLNVITRYVKLNDKTREKVDSFVEKNISGNQVLGIHYRGTDKKVSVQNHYGTPKLQSYLDEVDDYIHKYKIDKILLCTDDQEAINAFSQKYGDKLFFSDSYRAQPGDHRGIHVVHQAQRKNHNYKLGLEVITDAYSLAACTYLIFSHSNVTTAAILLNNRKYKHLSLVPDC